MSLNWLVVILPDDIKSLKACCDIPDAFDMAAVNPGACFSSRPKEALVTLPELSIRDKPPAKAFACWSDSFNWSAKLATPLVNVVVWLTEWVIP